MGTPRESHFCQRKALNPEGVMTLLTWVWVLKAQAAVNPHCLQVTLGVTHLSEFWSLVAMMY